MACLSSMTTFRRDTTTEKVPGPRELLSKGYAFLKDQSAGDPCSVSPLRRVGQGKRESQRGHDPFETARLQPEQRDAMSGRRSASRSL